MIGRWKLHEVINCPDTEKSKMMISTETMTGIRITGIIYNVHGVNMPLFLLLIRSVHSFIELIKFLFAVPNVTSFLSERISQDPLEKYFGRQRMRGGVNDNPNVSQFLKNNQALRMINSIDLDLVLGNCRGRNKKSLESTTVGVEPLKKRRRKSNKGAVKKVHIVSDFNVLNYI